MYYFWYFLDKEFKFQSSVCEGYHDVLMVSIDFNNNNIPVLNIHGVDYCRIRVKNLLRNADLSEKVARYKI